MTCLTIMAWIKKHFAGSLYILISLYVYQKLSYLGSHLFVKKNYSLLCPLELKPNAWNSHISILVISATAPEKRVWNQMLLHFNHLVMQQIIILKNLSPYRVKLHYFIYLLLAKYQHTTDLRAQNLARFFDMNVFRYECNY